MADRLALVTLRSPSGGVLPADDAQVVTAVGYSRFKHGDGEMAQAYGRALAHRYLHARADELTRLDHLVVTSSGYAQVPPAARSLVQPFVHAMRAALPVLAVEPVRVRRRGVSAGDYAAMSPGDRRVAVTGDCMTVADDAFVVGRRVVALDDIRVTGTHEQAMDVCLAAAGAVEVEHLYLVDAHEFAGEPTVESRLNTAGVRTLDELLRVVCAATFVPNARVCRRVMTLPAAAMSDFVERAPQPVLAWMERATELDRLDRVGPYRAGVTAFRALLADGVTAGSASA